MVNDSFEIQKMSQMKLCSVKFSEWNVSLNVTENEFLI